MSDLQAFLTDAEHRRFEPGRWDCCLFVADWVQRRTGIDAAEPWRGRYRTVRGYQRHLTTAGGLEAVMVQAAERAGLAETTEPAPGDVGLIEGGNGPTAAICLGARWASVGSQGVAAIGARPLRAWRVPLKLRPSPSRGT